ncbi:hypothetical protein EVAR_7846_1 [Eumeta japonica]|uniref:Uncharacterized protein n=1 Tax=Eumeta variegata TaxID=151549 RepID=A0A4C1TUZ0_EUMVA|nr:hypothetical protein EVAR_7846_1 [Eumeta japonica]
MIVTIAEVSCKPHEIQPSQRDFYQPLIRRRRRRRALNWTGRAREGTAPIGTADSGLLSDHYHEEDGFNAVDINIDCVFFLLMRLVTFDAGGMWRGVVLMKENPTARSFYPKFFQNKRLRGHSFVSFYHELYSTGVVFGHRRIGTYPTNIFSQISATRFEIVKAVVNNDRAVSFLGTRLVDARRAVGSLGPEHPEAVVTLRVVVKSGCAGAAGPHVPRVTHLAGRPPRRPPGARPNDPTPAVRRAREITYVALRRSAVRAARVD